MDIRQIFGQRLRQARMRAKLSMDALCELLDGAVTKQSISKYEKGLMLPDDEVRTKLCEVLNQRPDFFRRPITCDAERMEISFRKKCMSARDLNALKIDIMDDVERFVELDEIMGRKSCFTPVKASPLRTRQSLATCARKVREEWKLGCAPISNSQTLLEEHGIDVILFCGDDNFDGVSVKVNDKPIIILNSNEKITAERRRFTAMHELGHILFNDYMEGDSHEREKMCHAFASEMLLPREVVMNFFNGKRNVSLKELYYLQSIFGISVDAIMYKLHGMGIVSDKRYRTYCVIRNEPALRSEIETSRFSEEIIVSKFETKVYSALAQNLITETKAASLLKTTLEEVRNALNKI